MKFRSFGFASFVRRAAVVAFSLSAIFASGEARAEGILYVNGAATGAGDGSSWSDAYTDLPKAVKAANEACGSIMRTVEPW